MSLKKILNTVQKHKSFLVSTHIHPDPDALASELVMAQYLKSLGKRVRVINVDDVPRRYAFLTDIALVERYEEDLRYDYEVAIIVDCGDLDRLDKVKALISKKHILINIDHHVTNDHFGDLNWVNPQASSTAEVIYELLKKDHFGLTPDMAQLLYLGIMTDTGSFRYDSTTSRTHVVASELMKHPFSVSELYRKIYERIPFKDIKMFMKVISAMKSHFDGRVIFLSLHEKVLQGFSEDFDVKDKIFTFLRSIKGVEVIAIFSAQKKNLTRINFRSQGQSVDVAKLANYFGGGGHQKASGCIMENNLAQAQQKVLARLERII